MKHFFYFLLPVALILSGHSAVAQQDKDLHNFYADKLKSNGIILPDTAVLKDYTDVQRLIDFNFDNYRAYDSKALVAIKRGPVVELISIKDVLSAGKKIDNSLLESKKEAASTTYEYAIMPIVDVKFGYTAPAKDKEKTTIFMTPKDARR